MSFQEWVGTITYGDEKFLESCQIGPTGNIHLIYDEKHESTIDLLFGTDFREFALKHFTENDVNEIFKSKKIQVQEKSNKKLNAAESEYADFLKRKFMHNPQDSQVSATTKVTKNKTYAEASKEPPMKMNRLNLHYSQFSPKVADKNDTTQIQITLQQVLKRVNELETSQNTVPTKDTTYHEQMQYDLEVKMDEKLKRFDDTLNTKLSKLEEETNKKMLKSESMILSKFEEMQVATSHKMQSLFEDKMNVMNATLGNFMINLENKLGSTGATNTQMGGVGVPGKSL